MQIGFIELDDDIIQNPAYWIITAGCIFALMLGFGAFGVVESLGIHQEYQIPLFWKIIILILTPVISYFVVMKFKS